MKRDEIEGEINACKNILDNTDYQILRAIEEIFAADDVITLLKAISDAGKVIKDTIKLRKQMRDRINELEAMTPEDEAPVEAPPEEVVPEAPEGDTE